MARPVGPLGHEEKRTVFIRVTGLACVANEHTVIENVAVNGVVSVKRQRGSQALWAPQAFGEAFNDRSIGEGDDVLRELVQHEKRGDLKVAPK